MLITPDAIAEALETAPGWAKIALTIDSPRLREDARHELGQHVYDSIFRPEVDNEQLALPL